MFEIDFSDILSEITYFAFEEINEWTELNSDAIVCHFETQVVEIKYEEESFASSVKLILDSKSLEKLNNKLRSLGDSQKVSILNRKLKKLKIRFIMSKEFTVTRWTKNVFWH